jgi:OmcA/MtrC family decaheme c-type cytochrome
MSRTGVLGILLLGLATSAGAVSIPGGGSKRNDCAVALQADGLAFPAGNERPKGTSCADGGPCDADGTIDGACEFLVAFCLNVATPSGCGTSEVSAITVKKGTLKGGGTLDVTGLQTVADALELPSSESPCSGTTSLVVPVRGPDGKGELSSGTAKVKVLAATSRGKDKDQYALVCRPATGVPGSTTSTAPPPTTTTSVPGTTTTSSTLPPGGVPGAGLRTEIQSATVDAAGVVTVTFLLTDDAGVPITPQSASTSDPNRARARFAIARLEVNDETVEGFTTTFTRYQNYILNSSGAPAYDSGGTFAPAGDGTWTYTFGRMLPAGFPADLTHTIGAQIQRTFDGEGLAANPIFDFVPGGGATTTRQVTSTAQCNGCHDPLGAHGGDRREVRLCQLCHTDQFADPDTGASIDFKNMVHRIHRGKDLPSVTGGALGAHYGFGDDFFAERVAACEGGALAGIPCTNDGECPGGTCSGTTAVGVGFPQDVRNCAVCHTADAEAPDAGNAMTRPSALSCTGCHDDVNPSETTTDAGPPGTGHIAGDQPDALCRLCHGDEGSEFDESVPGAHVVPARSQELTGIVASIQNVQGAPGGALTVDFQVVDGAGAPLAIAGFNRVALATSGPTTDLGGGSVPLVQATMVGGGSSGVLTGPDGSGNYSYASAVLLPADAAGTWQLGLELRRPVTLSNGATVNEAAPNPVTAFSVDGSPVEERRVVVDMAKCASCHGTFSVDFSIHGNLRNQVEYCVICHNPNVTDFERRRNAVGVGADAANETISFEHLIHKVHRGEALAHHPYVVYGFGAAPANFTAHDFAEVLFPGDLRNCQTCHAEDTELLPLPDGLLPTRASVVDTSSGTAVEVVTGAVPPVQDACLACHDGDDVAAHAETNTTGAGAEACNVCHAEGSVAAVSEVHAR